jgi:hypothetical protein
LLAFSQQVTATANLTIKKSAARYVPGFVWREKSIVMGDFSCRGRKQAAVLGTSPEEIVVVVFLNGTSNRPEVLHYSARTRNPASVTLATENLDYDPEAEIGTILPGFRKSKTCKGLNLSDSEVDSAHIYWNWESRRFDDWTR